MTNLKNSITQTEQMFAGCLVATETRPDGLPVQLRRNIQPGEIEDPVARVIFKAAIRAHQDDWSMTPTPEVPDEERVAIWKKRPGCGSNWTRF